MYYYIVDPPQTKADQQIVSALRNRLIPEGLAGEFVFRTPGQSAGVLADKALAQGFSTIVSVGSDALAGELAAALYDQPSALGIVPINATSALHDIIGYSDWKEAVSALRARKIALRDLGTINGELCFITEIEIRAPKTTHFHIHMNRYTASIEAKNIFIKLSNDNPPFDVPGVLNFAVPELVRTSFFSWNKQASTTLSTLLRGEQAVIQADIEAEAIYGGMVIAKTPISLAIVPQAIRMIVATKRSH